MTKQRHCFVTQVGDAIEALASALDPEREPPFKGDILDLLEWATKDVLAIRQQLDIWKAAAAEKNLVIARLKERADTVDDLRQQLAARDAQIESLKASMYGHYELEKDRDTAWAQAHRLALDLECLIMDTKDNAIVSKWWDSAFEAMEEYHNLKPGAAEDAEAWAKIRKAGI